MTTKTRRTITPLTDRQREIFGYIFDQTMRNGFQPSVREVMEAFDIKSPNGVVCQLRAMCNKGWIGSSDNASRSIPFHLTPDGRPFKGFACREETR